MRGKKPTNKVKIEWSSDFAYALGLITTDGSLSNDRRHISFTTKDLEQANNFRSSLLLTNIIGNKASRRGCDKKYYTVQFGDVNFYNFLIDFGLMPSKSLRIKELIVPDNYFFDFLRGYFDGDGTFYSYWDKRWRSSYMFYTVFCAASYSHICWLRNEISKKLGIKGHITDAATSRCYQLRYAKKESMLLLKKLYPAGKIRCLLRKRIKIQKALRIAGQKARVEKLVNSPP